MKALIAVKECYKHWAPAKVVVWKYLVQYDAWVRKGIFLALGIGVIQALLGCLSAFAPSAGHAITTTVPSGIQIPFTVERLAILYPKIAEHELASAYNRLEGASFQLKTQRLSLKIVDRHDLDTILKEQELQVAGTVSDATAAHVGRVLGADSVLLYHIETPNIRDRTLAKVSRQLPSILVISKVILVESGEVVYHNVVTIAVEKFDHDQSFFSVEPILQGALDRGVGQTIADLQHAFR